MRMPAGFLTKAKAVPEPSGVRADPFPEPGGEFLRAVRRISLRRPEIVSAPSAIGFALELFTFFFILFLLLIRLT